MASSLGSEGMIAIGLKECPNADDVGAPLQRVCAGDLGPVLGWEGQVGQHVVTGGIRKAAS